MKQKTKKLISYIVSLIVIAVAVIWISGKFRHPGNVEYTDNAQIGRQIVPVNNRIQGYIREIRFKEYQYVKKGDTLVIIDDADMRLSVARARADYNNAVAGRGVADKRVGVASAEVAVSDASIEEAQIVMELAATDLKRYEKLLAKDAVTRQQYDAIHTDYDAKRARYETLKRRKTATATVVDESSHRIAQSDAGVELAAAMLESAELNLSYTVITSPCDGFTTRKNIQVGQLVQPGQTLLDIVDATDVWVTANYKETQLKHIKPGSDVRIKVDAVPGIVLLGKVKAISNATGAALSILPQDNSAGNFVKVRQRIPVRIEFTGENKMEDLARLSAGMNVESEVIY